ncbi:MAG: DUF4129 domain-containing protein [Phaeodactylibacter sp.]|nr:DUF4129 domain-containing protein [Phaeodactylibacter sp.]
MKKLQVHIILCLGLLLFGAVTAAAQQDTHDEARLYQGVSLRPLDEARWDSLTRDLVYQTDQVPERRSADDARASRNSNFWAPVFKFIFIAIPVGLLAWVLWKALQSPIGLGRNQSPEKATVSKSQQADLQEVIDLSQDEQALQRAIQQGDFSQAVRLYYLKLIAALVKHRQIQWRKEKTNSDYLREVRRQAYYADYEFLTRQYENTWYGKQPMSAEAFQELVPHFRQLEARIQSNRP